MANVRLRFLKFSARLLVVTAVPLVMGGCLTMRVSESTWLHPAAATMPDSVRAEIQLARGATLEDVWMMASDSTQLYGLLVLTPGARVTVLYFGGDNFRVATAGAGLAAAASQLGVNALLMDYRGYGQSEGTPTVGTLKLDALEAYDELRRHRVAGSVPIVVHGFSLGSFIGAHLATERRVSGLVLESTATNVEAWARGFVPWYGKPFVRIRIASDLSAESNVARLQRYSGPLLLVVGEKDRITRPAMSEALYAISATPVERRYLVVVPGAGHGNALDDQAAAALYGAFLARILATQH